MPGKRITAIIVSVAVIGTAVFLSFGEVPNTPVSAAPALQIEVTNLENVSAESYVVFDVDTGKSLITHNEDQALPIASVTKLFTAAAVLEDSKLEATTTITWSDVNTEGDAGKLKPLVEYSERDLLWPLLLESSNDAAAALERVEPELIKEMNEYALSSNAAHTHFSDASGLSDGNVSTAKDLALMARDVFQKFPHLIDITQLPQYIGDQTGWVNNNPFVAVPEYRGGKHGFTEAANRTAAVFFEETLKNGQTRLIGYVVLGSDDLKGDVTELREHVQKQVSLQ